MTAPPHELEVRPFASAEIPAAIEMAARAGAHGVYVHNALVAATAESPGHVTDADLLGVFDADGAGVGLLYFGKRGNLIVVETQPLDGSLIARHVAAAGHAWRIALGPRPVLAALARGESLPPLVDRDQIYYGVSDTESVVDDGSLAVRRAGRADVKALVQAALELNGSDLNVQPWRVNKGWLKDSVKRRIREGRTFVTGPDGAPLCKLDLGSLGVAGIVIEGVYTVPEHRGCGLATRLVAEVVGSHLADYSFVCLHVGVDNTSARRAYERAGMSEVGSCRLLLRG